MAKKTSIKDVAERAGVSYTTVSHVINKTRYVSPEAVDRVKRAMIELNYQRNILAQSLRKSHSHTVGIIIPSLSYDFYVQVIKGVEKVLYKEDYNISLACSREDSEIEEKQIGMFASWQVEGMIIAPTSSSFANANPGGLSNCPVVCIDRIPSDTKTDSVETNCRDISRSIVEKLYDKGHRKIAFATCRPDLYPSHERMMGYEEGISEKELEGPVYFNRFEPTIEAGEKLAETLLEDEAISAVLIDNLQLCIGAMKYFTDHGISVPDRISVVSFDDSVWTSITNPPLTAVHQDAVEFGRRAAEILLKRINEPDTEIQHIVLDGQIIMRETT